MLYAGLCVCHVCVHKQVTHAGGYPTELTEDLCHGFTYDIGQHVETT